MERFLITVKRTDTGQECLTMEVQFEDPMLGPQGLTAHSFDETPLTGEHVVELKGPEHFQPFMDKDGAEVGPEGSLEHAVAQIGHWVAEECWNDDRVPRDEECTVTLTRVVERMVQDTGSPSGWEIAGSGPNDYDEAEEEVRCCPTRENFPPVDVDALRSVALLIEREGKRKFNQMTWLEAEPEEDGDEDEPIQDCMSPCCVAGWACIDSGEMTTRSEAEYGLGDDRSQAEVAGEYLGLTEDERSALFAARWPKAWFIGAGLKEEGGRGAATYKPKRKEAVAILRWMADRGEVPLAD